MGRKESNQTNKQACFEIQNFSLYQSVKPEVDYLLTILKSPFQN